MARRPASTPASLSRERLFGGAIAAAENRIDDAENAVVLIVRSRGEEQLLRARRRAAAELQCPQPIDLHVLTVGSAQLADEIAAAVEGIDAAVALIADQDIAAEL